MHRREISKILLGAAAGVAAVSRPAQAQSSTTPITPRQFGAVGNGVDNDDTALRQAYAAAAAAGEPLIIPKGKFKFYAPLLWNQKVDVIGAGREDSILVASDDPNHPGVPAPAIRIDGAAQESLFENFTVDRVTGDGCGVEVWLGNRITMRRVIIQNHPLHGLLLRAGGVGHYEDIISRDNSGDGIQIDSGTGTSGAAWACSWEHIDVIRNRGWGFNVNSGSSQFGSGIVSQNNTGGGVRVNANTCLLQIYCEANIGRDLLLTSSSVRNFITTNNIDATTDLDDQGVRNAILDMAVYPTLSVFQIAPVPPVANGVVGKDLTISGGSAWSGGTGASGGRLLLEGGGAGGAVGAGGAIRLLGGTGVGGGLNGDIIAGGGVSTAVRPNADNQVALGRASQRWKQIFAVTSTISTSDARDKRVRGRLSDAELRVARRLAGMSVLFQWRDSIDEKGDQARLHCGVLAQDIQRAFASEGLDANRYGVFCSDPIYREAENPVEANQAPGAGSKTTLVPMLDDYGRPLIRLGVRYTELSAFVMAAQEQRLATLEARLG